MSSGAKAVELVGLVGAVDPGALTVGTYTSAWAAAKHWEQFVAIVNTGTLGSAAVVNAKLEQATSSGGAGAKDIPGKAISAFTHAGSKSNKQALVNLRTAELDVNDGFQFVRLSLTVTGATSGVSGLLLGVSPTRGAVTEVDAATVDEVVG